VYRVALLGASVLSSIDTVEYWYGASVLLRTHWSGSIDGWMDSKAALSRAVCYCRRRSIQMRPLEGHWKLPEGCFCRYCRPFPVGKLDWPNVGSVSLFREIQGSVPIRSRTRRFYQFNLLLASLGPPASCCGQPALDAGLLSGLMGLAS